MTTIHIITDNTPLTTKTLRLLDLHGLPYTTQPVTDPGAAQAMAVMGYKAAPAVRIIRQGRPLTWNGFRPDLITKFLVRNRVTS